MKVPFKGPKKRIKKTTKFITQWRELQEYCRDKATWPEALIAADDLLNKALKKRRFKGKSMGERLVNAQRYITDNDDIWVAHNMVKKLKGDREIKLKESEVKEALLSFREALRDIGALPQGEEK